MSSIDGFLSNIAHIHRKYLILKLRFTERKIFYAALVHPTMTLATPPYLYSKVHENVSHFNYSCFALNCEMSYSGENTLCSPLISPPEQLIMLRQEVKYQVRQRGCSLTHSARTPPSVHQGITIWVDKIEFEKK